MTTIDHSDSRPNIGRDAYPLSVHESTVGKGTIVVGVVWLVLYVFAVVPSLISQPEALTTTVELSASVAVDR